MSRIATRSTAVTPANAKLTSKVFGNFTTTWIRLSESNRRPAHYAKHVRQHQTCWLHR